MALLRPCGRFAQSFAKLAVSCQGELVRDIFRLTRTQGYVTVTPKAANSTTNTEKLQVPSSNNLSEESEATSNFTKSLQRRLISLCLGAKNGRIRDGDFARILERYTSEKDSIEDPNYLTLLRYCGSMLPYVKSADRQTLTKHVWELISRKTSKLTLDHYNTLLRIHAQNNQRVEPKKFLSAMVVNPDDTTYKLLLNAAAKCGDVESALYILSRMKSEGLSLNEGVFNLLILAHATNKDIKAVLSTLDTMRNARIEPSTETYAYIACGYASVRDIHNTMKILNAYTLNVLQIMEVIKCLSSANLGQHIPTVLKYLPSSVSETDTIFLETLTELTHSGKPDDAFELLNFVAPAASPDESNPVFDGFLKDMIRAKIPNSTVLQFMTKIMTVKNYPLAIMDVCEGALRSGDRELAMAVFEAMHEQKIKVRPHYYWPLFIQASRGHGETDIFRTLKHMLCLNVPLDFDTIFQYVLPYINTADPFVTLRKFGDLGLEISATFTPTICYLLHQGRIKEALGLCSRIKAPIDFDRVVVGLSAAHKTTRNVNDLVKMFTFAPRGKFYPEEFLLIVFGRSPTGQNAQTLNEYLRAFEAAEIPVSNFTTVENVENAEESSEVTMINPLDSIRPSYRIPHPSDMSLEELECHLIELKAKGMNVRGILRKLLQMHCRENNLERVEAIKDEYDEKEFLWTPGMYSSLLQLYVQNGRLNEAMNLYSQIQHSKEFKIDDFKIIHLATALVNANRLSEAFTIIEATTSTGGSRISKDCWRLLDAIAHSSDHELTESMLEILVNAGFCEKSNTMLGPLVRQHLLRDNLNSAVGTFEKCAELYGHTPLRQELVYAIVEKMHKGDKEMRNEGMKLLERVQNITAKLRGSVTMKMDLFVALARLEMIDELRKFLQNNKVADQALSRNLGLVQEDHKLSILTTILDASIGIPNINRSSIYEQILAVHSRSGDCEKAIELWKKLLAEETLPSRNFRIALENLLTKHNVPFPEGFPETRFDQ